MIITKELRKVLNNYVAAAITGDAARGGGVERGVLADHAAIT